MIMKKFTLFFIIASLLMAVTSCGELGDLNRTMNSDNNSENASEDNATVDPGGGSEEGGNDNDNETVNPPTPPTPPVDPYVCLTDAELNSGSVAPSRNITIYPLVKFYGAEAPAGRYKAKTSSGGMIVTGSEYVDTVEITTNAGPLIKFSASPNNYVTVKNGKETLNTGYLKSDNLKENYNPTTNLKFLPNIIITYQGSSNIVRQPLNCSSPLCKPLQIPATPRLDTNKSYYAKMTYDLVWEESYPDILPGSYDLNFSPRFECFVEKK